MTLNCLGRPVPHSLVSPRVSDEWAVPAPGGSARYGSPVNAAHNCYLNFGVTGESWERLAKVRALNETPRIVRPNVLGMTLNCLGSVSDVDTLSGAKHTLDLNDHGVR